MNNDDYFIHNFCESRLTNYQPPEIYNSISALFMFFIPFFFGYPKNALFFNIAILLQFNGIASSYYHYNLNWLGKQMDEISMILANFFGMWSLFKILYRNQNDKINYYNKFNLIYATFFISVNTLTYLDFLFPILFGIYIAYTTYLIRQVSKIYKLIYKRYLVFSLFGVFYWLISELWCNNWTFLGHSCWHILFPIGFYKVILQYDNKKIAD